MISQPKQGKTAPLNQEGWLKPFRIQVQPDWRPTEPISGWAWVLGLGLAGLTWAIAAPSLAQSTSRVTTCRSLANQAFGIDPVQVFPLADDAPLRLRDLSRQSNLPDRPGECAQPGELVSSNTACQQRPTIPSLWWAKAQYGGRLLINWLAYPARENELDELGRVDLVVNRQVWSEMGYFDRYEFVQKFGNETQSYGYNIRLFDVKGNCLATYTCTAHALATRSSETPTLTCSIIFGY